MCARVLVEKRRELSPFPRSRLVNVRSMEIFRQFGLDAEIAAAAFGPEYGRIRFRDTLLDRDFATAAMAPPLARRRPFDTRRHRRMVHPADSGPHPLAAPRAMAAPHRDPSP